jgi:hypothetical protein
MLIAGRGREDTNNRVGEAIEERESRCWRLK